MIKFNRINKSETLPLFDSNTAASVGGGISLATDASPIIQRNNTFYGGGVAFYSDNPTATLNILNEIIWNSTPQGVSPVGVGPVIATYSDIEGGTGESWFGTGCIDLDPLFADPPSGDFHLTWLSFPIPDATKSPCIDAGDPTTPLDPDGTRADMGAFYFEQQTVLLGDVSGDGRITAYDASLLLRHVVGLIELSEH
ncbi:TPA: hypothetical protein EYP66_22010 [Candidatus Poribacteria bacterium]|nr:hypothetical protein [Candidatus Poribacteria bacterium]